jgi:hypothetical protein
VVLHVLEHIVLPRKPSRAGNVGTWEALTSNRRLVRRNMAEQVQVEVESSRASFNGTVISSLVLAVDMVAINVRLVYAHSNGVTGLLEITVTLKGCLASGKVTLKDFLLDNTGLQDCRWSGWWQVRRWVLVVV